MHATSTDEQWLTRADLAQLMHCSPDTVRRLTRKHGLQERTDTGGRVQLNVADCVRTGMLTPEDLRTGATPLESAELVRSRDTVLSLRVELAGLTGRLNEADMVRDTLREQLSVKDRQIAQQATQITQLIARLSAAGGAA